jgi:5'-3' exonuclease
MDKILLIDGHNSMWRASVSFGPPIKHERWIMSDPFARDSRVGILYPCCVCKSPWNEEEDFCYGQKYNLIFNFFRNLRPIIEMFSPDKCFFVLEGHPQFRYDLFADYKANRIIKYSSKQDMMDKFHIDKNIIINLIQHLPITICRAADYECDDVIASLCEDMKNENLTVLSNDSDYIQLLQRSYSNIQIYNPIKKVFMEAPPYPYVAWKCLAGDKSDNIPGLLKPKNALTCATDPIFFQKFMEVEENRANFSVNRQLIEFRSVPSEEIIFQEGIKNFNLIKSEFKKMKFESIVNDKSWGKYTKTFDCIRF